MPAFFTSEVGGDALIIGQHTMVIVTNYGVTIRARSSQNAVATSPGGWSWSSPVVVVDSVTANQYPSLAGPGPEGAIYCFYLTVVGTVAMKWSRDLGKTWSN